MFEQLQHRMISYEVIPPPAAWETIAARLNDDEKYGMLSDRVNQFETFPPSQLWGEILNTLDNPKNRRPIIGKRRWVFRSAAAAILAGVLIVGWMIFYKDAAVSVLVAKVTAPVVQPAEKPAINIPASDSVVAVNHHPAVSASRFSNGDAPGVKHGQSFIGASLSENVLPYALVSNPETLYPVAKIAAPSVAVKKEDLRMNFFALPVNGNYLMVEGPDGKLTRISSKFSSLIGLLMEGDETENYPETIKDSGSWKERFREWRNKISESSYIPASVNFLDIMELKDLILEEK